MNTHLNHKLAPEDDYVRLLQTEQILFWVKANSDANDNIFMMGDFNAEPNSPTYRLITEESGFKSAHKVVHGVEPEITFPTGLQAEFMDTDPPGCMDYIFFKGPNS